MDKANGQFGLIVAYLLPGFVGLAGMAPLVPAVAQWLQPVPQGDVGLGPPVYTVLAATALGMIVSCVRWLLLDHLHQWTGIRPRAGDFSLLSERLEAVDYLVEHHYRYYQFYGNTLVAALGMYLANRINTTSPLLGPGTDLGAFLLGAVLFAGSRDALRKYRLRVDSVLGPVAEKGWTGEVMTNGIDHHGASPTESKKSAATKPQPQPTASVRSDRGKQKPNGPGK